MTWLVAVIVVLWLARVAVEVRRWYWTRRWQRAKRAADAAWETFGWPSEAEIRERLR